MASKSPVDLSSGRPTERSPSSSGQREERKERYCGSERRHKLELVARRVSIVLLYSVLLVVGLLLFLLYYLIIWPAKR